MKENLVFVLRRPALGDCTNNGITYRNDMLKLLWGGTRQDAIQYATDKGLDLSKCLYMVERELWGEDHSFATPLIEPNGMCRVFGGNYVEGDGNCYRFRGEMCGRPIPVHDRYETQEDFDALSI